MVYNVCIGLDTTVLIWLIKDSTCCGRISFISFWAAPKSSGTSRGSVRVCFYQHIGKFVLRGVRLFFGGIMGMGVQPACSRFSYDD